MLRIPCPSLVPSFPLNLRLIYTTTLEGHLKYNMRKRELLGFPPKPVFPTNSLMLQITDVATQVKKPCVILRLPSLSPPHWILQQYLLTLPSKYVQELIISHNSLLSP